VETAARWPWKLESAKECVTTRRYNGVALKMEDGRDRSVAAGTASRQAWWLARHGVSGAGRLPVQILVGVAM